MSLSLSFAEFLLARASNGLSAKAAQAATDLICDGMAVAALGAREDAPRRLAALAEEAGGVPAATLIAQGAVRVPAVAAARVNGAAMHVLDFEPMWNPANHSLSTTLPALLALAEAREDVDGERLLLALAAGVETQAILRIASGMLEPGEFTFHPPGMVGAMGSAVGCAVLLGLDAPQLAMALGIAASRAGSLIANAGSMTKCLHCGDAAANGLEAALLAQRGFTADADAIGNPRGWGKAFGGDRFNAAALTAEAEDWHIVGPGPAFKLYPSQYGTHFVITAALAARKNWDGRSAIRRVIITVPAMAYVDRPIPASGLAGKFSFQYTAAAVLLDGRVDVETFSDGRRFADDMTSMLSCIDVQPNTTLEGRFDRMRVDVSIELVDGTLLTGSCDGPPGIWGRPIAREVLQAKWMNCLGAALGIERGRAVLNYAATIGSSNARGVRGLLEIVAARG
jgi:aconitate decarboxylase